VTDDSIQLLYYDRSIIIVSRPVNFLEDPSRFVAMLHAIANLTLPQLGYADVVKPAPLLDNPRQTTDIFDGLELKLSDSTRLLLGSTIFHQHGIIGRGTCVIRAKRVEKGKDSGTDDDAWDGPLIVKLSWPAKSRISENDIIEKARNAANHDEHRWVLKHLPKVLHAEDRPVNLLSRVLIDRMGDEYEERVLRIMAQDELSPITERTATVDVAQSLKIHRRSSLAVLQAMMCHPPTGNDQPID
jgi:Fungal protein kinase